jgi:hypothetical protein
LFSGLPLKRTRRFRRSDPETGRQTEAAADGGILVLGDQIQGPILKMPLWQLPVVRRGLGKGSLQRIEIAVDRKREPLSGVREREFTCRWLKPDPRLRSSIATFRLIAAAVSPSLRPASEKQPPSAARTKDSRSASVSIGSTTFNDCLKQEQNNTG